MKTFINFLTFIVMVGSVYLLAQCQKDEMTIMNNPQISDSKTGELANEQCYELKDGIIQFRSLESFQQMMRGLQGMTMTQLNAWVENLSGFEPMRTSNSNGTQTTDKEIIPDPVFATIVNSKGLFAIGDSLFFIDDEYEYIITQKQFNPNSDISVIREVGSKHKILHKLIGDARLKFSGWLLDTKYYWTPENRKCKLEAWNNSYFAYASFGIKLTNYLGSSKDDFDYSTISGTAKWKQNTEPTFHVNSYSQTEEHVKVNQIVMGWLAGLAVSFDVNYIDADYYMEERCSGVYKSFTWPEYWD